VTAWIKATGDFLMDCLLIFTGGNGLEHIAEKFGKQDKAEPFTP